MKNIYDRFSDICYTFSSYIPQITKIYNVLCSLTNNHIQNILICFIRLLIVATLADVMTEKEADSLAATHDITQFLLRQLRNALNDKKHRYMGYSVTELVRGKYLFPYYFCMWISYIVCSDYTTYHYMKYRGEGMIRRIFDQ